ncbi:MAG: hypothetical protein DCC68_10330 [Planctomycetota bacterium]|nr:MAG: hypothetical protein DCC68_10330 [Planctomycetota bacterium]
MTRPCSSPRDPNANWPVAGQTILKHGELEQPPCFSAFLPVVAAVAIWLAIAVPVAADPCGMVPPIYLAGGSPITRVGLQKTYVFYKNGVETFIIRPGFSGKVDEFGMLIPFPTPPAIRKVPDDVFAHVAAAIDPPEVIVDLHPKPADDTPTAASAVRDKDRAGESPLRFDDVRVLRQEAVGMYEVAVLEAGSAAALNRWMTDHGYKYPNGMDRVCNEYIAQRWCFVAVKTKVGNKSGVDPRPGQRSIDSKLPDGATFDGFVQAMGFRFKSEKLEVPMRLSSFNEGELHNVVYLLADGPQRIATMPEALVVRQLPGSELLRNVTEPLPVRILGGTDADLTDWHKQRLKTQRDPKPHNGIARDVFASDLLAVRSGELSLPHEEREKTLLRISERLGLRGGEIDVLHQQVLAEEHEKTVNAALADLKGMTMTVIDGDFDRKVLSRENILFRGFEMPADRNHPAAYDAKQFGPGGQREGTLYRTSRTVNNVERLVAVADPQRRTESNAAVLRSAAIVVAVIVAVGLFLRCRGGTKDVAARLWALLLIAIGIAALVTTSVAQERGGNRDTGGDGRKETAPVANRHLRELVRQLADADVAEDVVRSLVAHGDDAVPLLYGEAVEGPDMATRGWAIVALGEIGTKSADEHLERLHQDGNQPPLVRTWAAAARIELCREMETLLQRTNLATAFPATGRPLAMRLVAMTSTDGKPLEVAQLLRAAQQVPQLQSALAPAILATEPKELGATMLRDEDANARYTATQWLATLTAQHADERKTAEVAETIAGLLTFDAEAKQTPWHGGPLYVPSLSPQWPQAEARRLVGSLIAWHVWCDRREDREEQRKIDNALASVNLAGIVGYQFQGVGVDSANWLAAWSKVVGRDAVIEMLRAQGIDKESRYVNSLPER